MVGFLPAHLDPSCVNFRAGLWIRSSQQPWPVVELHRDEGRAGCLPGPCSCFFTAPAPSAPFVKSSAADTCIFCPFPLHCWRACQSWSRGHAGYTLDAGGEAGRCKVLHPRTTGAFLPWRRAGWRALVPHFSFWPPCSHSRSTASWEQATPFRIAPWAPDTCQIPWDSLDFVS